MSEITQGVKYVINETTFWFKKGDVVTPTLTAGKEVIRGAKTPSMVMMSVPTNKSKGYFTEEALLSEA